MIWPEHGGQPEAIRSLFGLPEQHRLLDFSANINPLGPPEAVGRLWPKLLAASEHYPDPDYRQAAAAVAAHAGVRREQVMITNGGAEAIYSAARLLAGGSALTVQPTFAEYAKACAHYGSVCSWITAAPDEPYPIEAVLRRMEEVNGVFVCRPNNPSGELIPQEIIVRLLERAKQTRTYLIVDEAFVDFATSPDAALTSLLDESEWLVLTRSLTKMYALPGLRAGYLLASEQIIRQLQVNRLPWSVSAPAALLLPELLQDDSFPSRTRQWLAAELDWLRAGLQALDLQMSHTTVNFYLLHDPLAVSQTAELYAFLLKHGVLARHTDTFPGLWGSHLRLAVRSRAENEQLLQVLAGWRQFQSMGVHL